MQGMQLTSTALSFYLCSRALCRAFKISKACSRLGRFRYDAPEHLRGRRWGWWSTISSHWQLLLLWLLLLLHSWLLLLRLILLWLLLVLMLLLLLHGRDRWNRG